MKTIVVNSRRKFWTRLIFMKTDLSVSYLIGTVLGYVDHVLILLFDLIWQFLLLHPYFSKYFLLLTFRILLPTVGENKFLVLIARIQQ